MEVKITVDGVEITTSDPLLTSRDGSVYYDRCVALVELTVTKAITLLNSIPRMNTEKATDTADASAINVMLV